MEQGEVFGFWHPLQPTLLPAVPTTELAMAPDKYYGYISTRTWHCLCDAVHRPLPLRLVCVTTFATTGRC